MLMATSIAFWWYSNVAVSNMLVGIALFEIFHDVQYLTIVWIFNLNRADRNPTSAGSRGSCSAEAGAWWACTWVWWRRTDR